MHVDKIRTYGTQYIFQNYWQYGTIIEYNCMKNTYKGIQI